MAKTKRRGLLLTNLGSPQSTNVEDVKKYLTEFLMDERVIDYPYLFRSLLVKKIVVPKRAPYSTESYKKVWRKEGSPLIIYANGLKEKVQSCLDMPVALSMRYGNPTTKMAFEELLKADPNLEEVIVLPLYPHYTMSSYDTAVEAVSSFHKKGKYPFSLQFLDPFYQNAQYIEALAETIRPYLEKGFDKVLFSYHGIPERHLKKDDRRIAGGISPHFKLPKVNYQQQARITSQLTAKVLGLKEDQYETSFQSRLAAAGREWLKPYTAERLTQLPKEGIKKLLVVCPAFINDCLETIEEIGMEGKETFEEAGGTNLTLVPCINDQDTFAKTIASWAENGAN